MDFDECNNHILFEQTFLKSHEIKVGKNKIKIVDNVMNNAKNT